MKPSENVRDYFGRLSIVNQIIMEARKANLEETLLTQANIALMEQPLHMREIEEWRNHQAKYAPRSPVKTPAAPRG